MPPFVMLLANHQLDVWSLVFCLLSQADVGVQHRGQRSRGGGRSAT